MSMNTAQFAKTIALTLYDKPMRVAAGEKVFEWDKVVDNGTMKYATWQTYQFVGLGAANRTNELQAISYEGGAELPAVTITAYKYTKGFMLSAELEEDNRQIPGFLGSMAASTGEGHRYAREYAIAQLFVNILGTTLSYDSVAVCGAHTTNSGTTITNYDTTPSALSYSNLWDGCKYFSYGIYNEAGLPITDQPVYVQTHPENQDVLDNLLKTRGPNRSEPGSADNDSNVLPMLQPLYNRLLTSQTQYIVHGKKQKNSILFKQRVALSSAWDDAFDLDGRKCKSRQRFGTGVTDHRFIYASAGA